MDLGRPGRRREQGQGQDAGGPYAQRILHDGLLWTDAGRRFPDGAPPTNIAGLE
jgi:hypothetical protein